MKEDIHTLTDAQLLALIVSFLLVLSLPLALFIYVRVQPYKGPPPEEVRRSYDNCLSHWWWQSDHEKGEDWPIADRTQDINRARLIAGDRELYRVYQDRWGVSRDCYWYEKQLTRALQSKEEVK